MVIKTDINLLPFIIGKSHMHSMGLEPTTSLSIQLLWEEVLIEL